MKNTVNTRILMLKKHLKLTDVRFCNQAKFSTGTLFRIRKEEEVSAKIIDQIVDNFGVSREWLLHGTGEMTISETVRVDEGDKKASWSEKAFEAIKSQNEHLEKEVQFLREMLKNITSKLGAANFNPGFDLAALIECEKCVETVRVAA